ncbi:hypothetical protein PG1C_05715 [Rugosibacter aromaticivorans]|uniref:Uncharacterized protein n=1 Tax=Rugosibacter aromaticivorans TaxID=1565605 RepID=A0A0C5J8Y3_9PROT|nr:hypothetical protein [Rugosibacter aromaticivorans]AJP48094.1 hypothetical protein PG1C_05715 [Rugosibacter aromaticivorans]TBR14286.1 MAG: hypothetical protein EPO43_07935 [Rugosibacter sp.]
MFDLPGSRIQFGPKPAKPKRGRPSNQSRFLENQKDLFPVDLYIVKLSVSTKVITDSDSFEAVAEGRRSRPGDASKLYVPVTRKVSLKPIQK